MHVCTPVDTITVCVGTVMSLTHFKETPVASNPGSVRGRETAPTNYHTIFSDIILRVGLPVFSCYLVAVSGTFLQVEAYYYSVKL